MAAACTVLRAAAGCILVHAVSDLPPLWRVVAAFVSQSVVQLLLHVAESVARASAACLPPIQEKKHKTLCRYFILVKKRTL